MASVSALASGAALGAEGLCLPGELSICRIASSAPVTAHQTIEVTLGQYTWQIAPTAFGSRARGTWDLNEANEHYVIQLTGARFPGTRLKMDFTAVLYRSRGEWVVRLNFDVVDRQIELPLTAWMQARDGGPAYAGDMPEHRSIALASGACSLTAVAGKLALRVDARFRCTVSCASGMSFVSDRVNFRLDSARFFPPGTWESSASARPLPAAVGPTYARIKMFGLSLPGGDFEPVQVGRRQKLRLIPRIFHANLFLHPIKSAEHLLEMHSGPEPDKPAGSTCATLQFDGRASGPYGARVQLGGWVIIGKMNSRWKDFQFIGQLESAANGGLAVEGNAVTALVGHTRAKLEPAAESAWEVRFDPFQRNRFIAFQAVLYGAHLPIPGASAASLAFEPGQVMLLRFGEPFALSKRPANMALFEIGPEYCSMAVPLDHAVLRVRRSADNFDLTFRLLNYRLSVERRQVSVIPRLLPVVSAPDWPKAPTMVVGFPPQHLYEEAFLDAERPLPDPECLPATNNGRPWPPETPPPRSDGDPPDPIRRTLSNRTPDLARTRLANGTRIAFKMLGQQPPAGVPLTIEWLSNWKGRALDVDCRALPRNATLTDQLKFVGIPHDLPKATARAKARELILAKMTGEPSQYKTAIEAVYRLIVSTDCTASFAAPMAAPDLRYPVLWAAELDGDPRIAVRALHARGMDPARDFFGDKRRPGRRPADPFTASVNFNDRMQIVAMSSFYGIPALRRLVPEEKSGFTKMREFLRIADGGPTWKDDPNGMVFLPSEHKYTYLDDSPVHGLPQEGVIVAKPFDRYRLRLGRGADLESLWQGEPPAPLFNDPFFPKAFTIERYLHRNVQGCDAHVEVLYKGFVFPIGHRVSYIKLTYRDYKAYLVDPLGDPTAYLVQEYYLVCNKPRKLFSAYNQPFGSKDFPCDSVTLLTTRTPKLDDPCDLRFTEPNEPVAEVGKVFWPTVPGGPSPVVFAIQIDGQAGVAHTNLLFVDNAAAHHPPTMARVARYYNEVAPAGRRTVSHADAVRRYSPELKKGASSYKTREWLLAARGRLGADGSEVFHMDAFMEGQDQPPFYPFVEEALVNVESVERLTGNPGLYITTAYNANFVRHGFDNSQNPSEIFLDVIRPDLPLDGNNSQGATGGVASMAALLGGLSRTIGPVGGRRLPVVKEGTGVPLMGMAATSARVGGRAIRQYDTTIAQSGGFDPMEYLGGAFNDAKLLGCIPLKDVLKAALITCAPKLVEQASHGLKNAAGDINEMRDKLKQAVLAALGTVKKLVDDAEKEVNDALAAQYPGLTLAGLYRDLARALENLRTLAVAGRKQLTEQANLELVTIQALASDFTSGVEDLLGELEVLARDPVPTLVKEKLKQLQDIWEIIRNPFGTLLEQLKEHLIDTLRRQLVQQLCGPETRHQLVLLFGSVAAGLPGESDAAYCERIVSLLRHPEDALESLRDALLYEAFSKPMFELLQALAGNLADISGALAWSRQRVVTLITGIIRRNAAAVPEERLAVVGEQIAVAIEEALLSGKILLDQLPKRIDTIVQTAVQGAAADLARLLTELETEFNKMLVGVRGEIQAALRAQVDAIITEEMEIAYRELLNKQRMWEDRLTAAKVLYDVVTGPMWKTLLASLVDEVRQEFQRAVDDQLERLKAEARKQLDAKLSSILLACEQTLALVEKSAAMRALSQFGAQMGEVCAAASTDLRALLDPVVTGFGADRAEIDKQLKEADASLALANAALVQLPLPREVPASVRDTLLAALSTLKTAVGNVRQLCAESAALEAKWHGQWAANCNPEEVLKRSSQMVSLRRRLGESLVSALTAAQGFIDSLRFGSVVRATTVDQLKEIKLEVEKTTRALGTLVAQVSGLAKVGPGGSYADIKNRLLALTPKIDGLDDKFKQIEDLAAELKAASKPWLELATLVRDKYADLDRYLVSIVVQIILPKNLLDKLDGMLMPLVRQLAGWLVPVHEKVHKHAQELNTLVTTPGPAGLSLASVLSADIVAGLGQGVKLAEADHKSFTAIAKQTDVVQMHNDVKALRDSWAKGEGGIAQLARLVGKIVELVSSGNAASLFINVATLEKALRDAILSFVPTKVDLRYDFDAPLSDFPSTNPIFTMDRANFGTKEREYEDGFPKNDLVLSTRINIDLMTGQREVKADGRIRPFTLNLLGSFDLIGISFSGAHFQAAPGKRVVFDTQISGVRIGAMLEFLTMIQQYFSSGEGDGLYYDMQFLPPALEVGYRFNQPLIIVGPMLLLNVGFRVGARLPLDDRQAEFFAQLSSREYPLLIVMTPYGGGGFFGLRATARGIVSFEIQLEFGFVGAMAFGPLSAQARATAGIYLMQGGGVRVLEGFFHAMGEGNIAGFGIGVNIEIRMRQEGDGAMQGSARYSYSFSVGFFEIEFEVEVSRRQENGSGGGGGSSSAAAMDLLTTTGAAALTCPAMDTATCAPSILRSMAYDKRSEWGRYRQHVEI